MEFITGNFKWVMLVSGLLTATMFYGQEFLVQAAPAIIMDVAVVLATLICFVVVRVQRHNA